MPYQGGLYEEGEFNRPDTSMFDVRTTTRRVNLVEWGKAKSEAYATAQKDSCRTKRSADELDSGEGVPLELKSPNEIAKSVGQTNFVNLSKRGYYDTATYGADNMVSLDDSGNHYPGLGMTIEHMANVAMSPLHEKIFPLQATDPNGPSTCAVWSSIQFAPATALPKGEFAPSVVVTANITVVQASLQIVGLITSIPTEFLNKPAGTMIWAAAIVQTGLGIANAERLMPLVAVGTAYNYTPECPFNVDCSLTYDEYYNQMAKEFAAFQNPNPAAITLAFGDAVEKLQSRTNVIFNTEDFTFLLDNAALKTITRARVDIGQLNNIMDIYVLFNDTSRLIKLFNYGIYVVPTIPLQNGNIIHVLQHTVSFGERLHVDSHWRERATGYTSRWLNRKVMTAAGWTMITPTEMNNLNIAWDFAELDRDVPNDLPSWPWPMLDEGGHRAKCNHPVRVIDAVLTTPHGFTIEKAVECRKQWMEMLVNCLYTNAEKNAAEKEAFIESICDGGKAEVFDRELKDGEDADADYYKKPGTERLNSYMATPFTKDGIQRLIDKNWPLPGEFYLFSPFMGGISTDMPLVGSGAIKRVVKPGIATMTNRPNNWTEFGVERRQGAAIQFPERIVIHSNVAILRRRAGDDPESTKKLQHTDDFDPGTGTIKGAMFSLLLPIGYEAPVNMNILNQVSKTGLTLLPSEENNGHPCAGIIDTVYDLSSKIRMFAPSVQNGIQHNGRCQMPPNLNCRPRACQEPNIDTTRLGTWITVDSGNSYWHTWGTYTGCQNSRYGGVFEERSEKTQ